MKITFLCGCIEPGRDGVGDYTRRLAAELIVLGHSVTAISLNDRAVANHVRETQWVEETGIPVYRLPSSWDSSRRYHQAKIWLDEIQPDWLSLQFVIYSFHPKGLPVGLSRELNGLAEGRRLHVMLHEIWIGFASISPLKDRLIGYLQKIIIERLLGSISVDLVTTTNGLYNSVLKQSNISSCILPLFSNIALAESSEEFTSEVLNKLTIQQAERDQWRIIGVFGNIYPDAALENALIEEIELGKKYNKKLAFIGFGRTDDTGLNEFRRLEGAYSSQMRFYHSGELPDEHVSRLFQILDVGISCTPQQHLGKSGVFAAMKYHGVDVKVPTRTSIPEYDDVIASYHKEMASKPAHAWGVSHVCQQFLNLIHQVHD